MRARLAAIFGLFLAACGSSPDDDGAPDAGGKDGGRDATDGGPGADAGGGGSFTERELDFSGVHGQGVEIVDFEGDGDTDVLVAFSFSDTVRLYLNDGSGGFTTAHPTPNDTIVGMYAVADDFDGDGDRDVAAIGLFDRAAGSASQGKIAWYENPGDPNGSWTAHEIAPLWFPIYLAAGDLTGDGRADLVVGCTFNDPNGNGVFWFRNTGGGFSAPIPIEATLPNARTVLIHDVDGDGVLDVLASATGGDEIVFFENERTGPSDDPTFARHTIAAPSQPFGMRLANFDADADLELVSSGNNGSGGQIAWYDPPADPRDLWTEHLVSDQFGDQATRVATGDFDGDGLTDVASVTYEDNEVRVYFADGAGTFTPALVMGGLTGSNAIHAADLDGDGRVDLVTTTYGYPDFDRISWWDNEP